MTYTAIQFEKKDNIARITLDRPDAANALNIDLARDLMHVSLECDEDADIRAVVMTGNGRMFCAGGDLKSFAAQGDKLSGAHEGGHDLFARRSLPFCAYGCAFDRGDQRNRCWRWDEHCLFM